MKLSTASSYIIGGRRKIYFTYKDEEYNKETHDLISRRLKKKEKLGVRDYYEIGDNINTQNTKQIQLANVNPIFSRKDNNEEFIFRVRNLFGYQKDFFTLDIDTQKQEIILRTTNKKYFKRFDIPDLKRNQIILNKNNLNFQFSNSTLIIRYKKPQKVLEMEQQLRNKLEQLNQQNFEEGDLECCTQ